MPTDMEPALAVGRSSEKNMPHHDPVALSGAIRHVFAHRFVLEVEGAFHLADLGPKGAEAFPLIEGLEVDLRGERRPSEIKVTEIVAPGRDPVHVHHKKPHHPHAASPSQAGSDPALASKAAAASGWTPRGEPRRKPKHFEILARKTGGEWMEVHVDLVGTVYKAKVADPAKWGGHLD